MAGPGAFDVGSLARSFLWAVEGLVAVVLLLIRARSLRRLPAEWAGRALPWARVGLLACWASLPFAIDAGPSHGGAIRWLSGFLPFLVLVHALVYVRKKDLMPRLATATTMICLPATLLASGRLPAWDAPVATVALALLSGPLLAWMVRPGGRRPAAAWLTMGPLVFLSMAVAVLLLCASLTSFVGGGAAWARVALAACVPFLYLMGFALSNKDLGRPGPLIAAGASVAITCVGFATAAARWEVCVLVPAFVYGFLGACVKVFRASDDGQGPWPLRLAGGLLLFGGLSSLAVARPPFWAPGVEMLAVAGAVGSACACFAGISCLRRRSWRGAAAGGVVLALVSPFVAVAVSSVIASIPILILRPRFGSRTDGKEGLRKPLRKTAIYTIHVGAVAALAGYAAWTFAVDAPAEVLGRGGFILAAAGMAGLLALGGWRPEATPDSSRPLS